MLLYAHNSGKLKQENQEYKTSIRYIGSSRPAWATPGPVLPPPQKKTHTRIVSNYKELYDNYIRTKGRNQEVVVHTCNPRKAEVGLSL